MCSSDHYERPHFRGGNYQDMVQLMAKKGQLVDFIRQKALEEKRALAKHYTFLKSQQTALADIAQQINAQVENVDAQANEHEAKVSKEQNDIDHLKKEIDTFTEQIEELRASIAANDPQKKKCVEQILNAKKRISQDTMKVINLYLQKNSTPIVVQLIERLVGMLQGKGGEQSDRVGVELYFKSFVGFLRSIEEFNYKEVTK